jgi:hypothetical protein
MACRKTIFNSKEGVVEKEVSAEWVEGSALTGRHDQASGLKSVNQLTIRSHY